MRKIIFIIIFLAIIDIYNYCNAQKFKIKGYTEQIDKSWVAQTHYKPVNGKYVYLLKKINGKKVKIDSCILKNNKFSFKGKVNEVEVLTVRLVKKVDLDIFVENTNIKVEAPIKKYNVENPIIKGSETDNIYRDYQKSIDKIYEPIIELYSKARNNSDPEKKKYLNQKKYEARRLAHKLKLEFIENNYSSIIAPYLLLQKAHRADPKELKNHYLKLSKKVKKTSLGEDLKNTLNRIDNLSIGKKAPNFTLFDFNNKKVSLKDFRGKCVLLDFWGSWCGPCKKSFPYLKELYIKYKDKGFEIIGITLDGDKDRWGKVIDEYGLPWIQLSKIKTESSIFEIYNVKAVPTTYLIDKNGYIIKNNPHGKEIESALNKILN